MTNHFPSLLAAVAHRLVCSLAMATGALGAPLSAYADTAPLVIQVSGFQNDSGHAIAKLFTDGDDVRGKGRYEFLSPIRGGQAVIAIAVLPPGDYAIVVFHDSNDNGVIDHNFVGLPSEALGFSNGFRLSLMSGLPTFTKLRWTHGHQAQTLAIRVE